MTWYIYNGVLFSHRKSEILPFLTWTDPYGIMLSKTSQTESIHTVCYYFYVKSEKLNKQMNVIKQKETYRYRE